MNSVFGSNVLEPSYYWMTISDIESSIIERWRQSVKAKGLNMSHTRMPHRINLNKIEEVLKRNNKMIEIVQLEVSELLECMLKPYIFILTDPQGVVLAVHGQTQLVDILDLINNIGVGTSFAMGHAGLNAISMAIELMKCIFTRGVEHDLEIFSTWNCLCSTVRVGEEIIGYLDMSFAETEDLILAGSMFEHLLRSICGKLLDLCPGVKREHIYNQFNIHKLSQREKEVGYYWLMNHSTLRMAEEMGIAEGTVRNVLKKIYIKTRVNDKGQFFRKFL